MLLELIVIGIMSTLVFGLIIILAQQGEKECLEGLDECLQEWESVKEGWNEA
ncbi:MAG: hypothetical protein ACXABX_07160 [Candidatus Thorarchaeota archaeon]|jgi:hypothetical protein